MKIRIPILLQDPSFWDTMSVDGNALPPIEGAEFIRSSFEDGPRTDLVVISDAEQVAIEKGKGKIGGYRGPLGGNILAEIRDLLKTGDRKKILNALYSRQFILVSTFACVLRTMSVLENKNVLGRPIAWEFSPLPLECWPIEETKGKDARYVREAHRIYFGFSPGTDGKGQATYLSLSREAVAHETAHAIVDGINPHLYNTGNPHARALHESLADLTALLMTLKSNTLMDYVMGLSSGSLDGENAFSQFAENIGHLLSDGKRKTLRSFFNNEELTDPIGGGVYQASTVLSGSIWDVIRKHHAPYRNELARTVYKDKPNPQYSASGRPLADLARRLRTLFYRALDYLPGGEITLADYGRALILVDRIQFGENTEIAKSLEEAFLRRKIFKYPMPSTTDDNPANYPPLPAGGWQAITANQKLRKDFIQGARNWLGIPNDIGFDQLVVEIQPSIEPPESESEFIEVVNFRNSPVGILRILWNETVANIPGGRMSNIAPRRAKLVGTTLVIDSVKERILARLSSATPTDDLYPRAEIRNARELEISAHDDETGLYLDDCRIVNTEQLDGSGELISNTGRIQGNTIFLSGRGLSLHADDVPAILIKAEQ